MQWATTRLRRSGRGGCQSSKRRQNEEAKHESLRRNGGQNRTILKRGYCDKYKLPARGGPTDFPHFPRAATTQMIVGSFRSVFRDLGRIVDIKHSIRIVCIEAFVEARCDGVPFEGSLQPKPAMFDNLADPAIVAMVQDRRPLAALKRNIHYDHEERDPTEGPE